MHLQPGTPFTGPVLAHLPFALPKHFQPRRIGHDLDRTRTLATLNLHRQRAHSTRQVRVIRYRQIQTHQPHQRAPKPFQGAIGQMKDLLVHHNSVWIDQSEYNTGAPRFPVGAANHDCWRASESNQNVMSPRATRARSYSGQLVTR